MPQNPIQFRHGMSLSEFVAQCGTEALYEQALEQARWPHGFVCPKYGTREHSHFVADALRYRQCAKYRAHCSVCFGTLFYATKRRLTAWFQAIYLVTQNKNNISTRSLKRYLGVSDSTLWRGKHKPLEAMHQRESRRLLKGVVFADDAVLGGVQAGKPGRGSENRAPLMCAVGRDDNGDPQHVRFDPIDDYKGETFAAWARSALYPSAHLVSDGCVGLNAACAEVAAHGAIIVGTRKSSQIEPFRGVNTFISNVKTAIACTYQHGDPDKYRDRYLSEVQYRVNHRSDLASLVRQRAHACVRTAPGPERWLRLAEVGAS